MAKGPIVTPEVEALITSIYMKHPKWKAPGIRNIVEGTIRKNNRKLPKGWPSLSTVQKSLAEVRRNMANPSPEDEPWSTAEINKYPELKIEPPTPEALEVLFKVWKSRISRGDTFTIREAKWTARLSMFEQDTKRLSFIASRHARTELIFELISRPFNSTELDRALMGLPVAISGFESFLWLLAETREDTERGIKDGVDQVREGIKKKKQKRGRSK
ncbi:MAG: hypothetical protein ABSF21_00595 [Dehalococcoidia bacterium]